MSDPMNGAPTVPPPPAPQPQGWWSRFGPAGAVATVLGSAVLHLAAVLVLLAIDHHRHPPTCVGLGWGCSPGPVFTTALWGIFPVGPVAAPFVAAAALTGLLPDGVRVRAARVVALLALVVAVAGVVIAYDQMVR